jgi:signal transduction histidine kinase
LHKTFTRIFSILILLITFFILIQSFIILKFVRHAVNQIISIELEQSADQLSILFDLHEHMISTSDKKMDGELFLSQFFPQVQSIRIYDDNGVYQHTIGKEPIVDEEVLRQRYKIPYRTVQQNNGEIFHFEILPFSRFQDVQRPVLKKMNSFIKYSIYMISISIPLAMAFAIFFAARIAEDSKNISASLIRLSKGERKVDFPEGKSLESHEISMAARQLQDQIVEKEKRQIRRIQELTHDLKSPLAGLYTQLESVELGALELSRERFSHFYSELGFLNSLIDNMAEVYRLVDDNVFYSPQEIRSTQLVNTLIDRFSPIAEEAGKILITDIKVSVFTADFNLMLRAVGNLISNAIQHGRGEEISFKIYVENDQVKFDLINNGHISEDELPHVLTRYWSKGRNGSGLGLPIAELIARKHNGNLKVQNLEEEDVLFSLSIPQNYRN